MNSGRSENRRSFSGVVSAVALTLILLGTPGLASAKEAVVRLWNWNIHDKKYQQKMYNQFNKEHKGHIKIDYSSIVSGMYDTVLDAAFIAKEQPDLFLPSGKYRFEYLRSNGLIKPLNDIAPAAELKAWMATYPPYLRKFAEGVSVFNGRIYLVDLWGESGYPGFPLYYNKTLFKQTGIGKPPATYTELRQTAAKVTQAGKGKFYGITHGLKFSGVWHQDVAGSLAHAAGGTGGYGGPAWGPSMITGRFHTSSPEFVNAFKVWMGMREDGSVLPGDMTMDDEQAKKYFATDKAALMFSGPWMVGNVIGYNPKADFDLVLPPTPDDGVRRGFYYVSSAGGAFGYVVSASTKNPEAVWEVVKFLSSLEYQEGYVKGGYGVSFLPEANKIQNFSFPQMYKFVEWASDPALRRVSPTWSPEVTNTLWGEYFPGVYPTYNDVLDGIYIGKLGLEALVELDRKLDAAVDEAIRRAQAAGIMVSRKDLSFPGWDLTKNWEPPAKK